MTVVIYYFFASVSKLPHEVRNKNYTAHQAPLYINEITDYRILYALTYFMKRTLFACMHIMCTHTKYMHTHTNTHKKNMLRESHTQTHSLTCRCSATLLPGN